MSPQTADIIRQIQRAVAASGVDLNPAPGDKPDQQDDNDQTEQSAERRETPTGCVRPCRVRTERPQNSQDEDDKKDGGEHGASPLILNAP